MVAMRSKHACWSSVNFDPVNTHALQPAGEHPGGRGGSTACGCSGGDGSPPSWLSCSSPSSMPLTAVHASCAASWGGVGRSRNSEASGGFSDAAWVGWVGWVAALLGTGAALPLGCSHISQRGAELCDRHEARTCTRVHTLFSKVQTPQFHGSSLVGTRRPSEANPRKSVSLRARLVRTRAAPRLSARLLGTVEGIVASCWTAGCTSRGAFNGR